MSYIAVPLQVNRNVIHTLYVRKHVPRGGGGGGEDSDSDSEVDEGSVVFAANIPRDATVDNIKDLCQALGGVILDGFDYQGRNHALIRLVDSAACDRFLAKARKLTAGSKPKSVQWRMYGPRGVEGLLGRHMARFPPEEDLLESVDKYMEEFAAEEQRQATEASQTGRVDDDGFTLVGNPKAKRRPAAALDLGATDPPAKKKKTQEKPDFYRFQIREQRKNEVSSLLRRYQHDKAKVEELKQKKRFRPY